MRSLSQINTGKSASVYERLRSAGLWAPQSRPQDPPEEQLPKQSLRFKLMQGNQACQGLDGNMDRETTPVPERTILDVWCGAHYIFSVYSEGQRLR